MGLACNIIRGAGGRVERVLAPNGNDSKLYRDAYNATGSEARSLETWAVAYTPGFESYFGNWEGADDSLRPLDQNGEPFLQDVVEYIKKGSMIVGSFTKEDVISINNFLNSTKREDLSELAGDIRAYFMRGGSVSLNYDDMVDSALYTPDEAARLMGDPDLRQAAESALGEVVRFDDSRSTRDRDEDSRIFFRVPSYFSPIGTGKYDRFGKESTYTDGEVELALLQTVGGVEDRSLYPGILKMSDYPELYDYYMENPSFHRSVDYLYPLAEIVPEHYFNEEGVEGVSVPAESNYMNYAHSNERLLPKIREKIREALAEDVSPRDIKDIEVMASNFGIDVAGLSGIYARLPQKARAMLVSLDVALPRGNSLNRGTASQFASDYHGVFKDDRAAEFLPDGLKKINAIRIRSPYGPIAMQERFGLLEVGPNLYIRNSINIPLESAYNTLVDTMSANPSYLPYGAYPDSSKTGGRPDAEKLKREDPAKLLASLKRYVLSRTDSFSSEEMVVSRLVRGLPARAYEQHPYILDAAARIVASRGRSVTPSDMSSIYEQRIRAKIENGSLWDNFFKFVRFNADGSMSLMTEDTATIKRMEAELAGDLRNKIESYALLSPDPSWQSLFPPDPMPLGAITDDILYGVYARNPRMLEETKGDYETIGDYHYIRNTYDNFVRLGRDAYIKVGESAEGSFYAHPVGTQAEIRRQLSSLNPPVVESNEKVADEPHIRDEFNVDTESLGLEC